MPEEIKPVEVPKPVEAAKPEGVTIKPSAIEDKRDEKPEDRMKRLNLSNLPGHTYETEQIQKQRDKEIADKGEVKYEFKANGYTVTEFEDKTVAKDPEGKFPKRYKVSAEGFELVIGTKAAAENYALTHAEAHKDLPATVSKT